jgi:tRNA (guanine-N7-)-methyltransferase
MTDNHTPPAIETPPLRRILTFMRRSSPLTAHQREGFDQYLGRYQLSRDVGRLDLAQVFGRRAPITLEIGFGMGHSLIAQAERHPERDFIGIEVHHPGVGALLYEAGTRGLTNIRVFEDDALEVLSQCIPDAALDTVQLFFPDPWPKKKHHKRRFVQAANAELIRQKLAPGGVFHMATDWQPYAEWMLEVMSAQPGYENATGPGQYAPRPESRPVTKFERRGEALGHGVWDLLFRRSA